MEVRHELPPGMQDALLRFFRPSWTTIRDQRPTNLFKDRESAILKSKDGSPLAGSSRRPSVQ